MSLLPSKRTTPQPIIASNELSASRASIYRYLEKAIFPQNLLISPCREIQKTENQKPQPIPKTAKKDGLTRTSTLSHRERHQLLAGNGHRYWTDRRKSCFSPLISPYCNFIFARLLDNKSANEVAKHLYAIKNDLHQKEMDFYEIFPVILTDNGGEFARVDDIEMDVRGESKLFFCDPNRSDQKGELRRITRLSGIFSLKELALIT